MRGWRRAAYFDQTGLVWTPPSPNLRSVAEAVLYPGVALVEGTNVSVGRGTDTPFEVVGAPWIDDRLAERLQAESLSGVAFASTQFTPTSSTYAGRDCTGIGSPSRPRGLRADPHRDPIRAFAELYPSS